MSMSIDVDEENYTFTTDNFEKPRLGTDIEEYAPLNRRRRREGEGINETFPNPGRRLVDTNGRPLLLNIECRSGEYGWINYQLTEGTEYNQTEVVTTDNGSGTYSYELTEWLSDYEYDSLPDEFIYYNTETRKHYKIAKNKLYKRLDDGPMPGPDPFRGDKDFSRRIKSNQQIWMTAINSVFSRFNNYDGEYPSVGAMLGFFVGLDNTESRTNFSYSNRYHDRFRQALRYVFKERHSNLYDERDVDINGDFDTAFLFDRLRHSRSPEDFNDRLDEILEAIYRFNEDIGSSFRKPKGDDKYRAKLAIHMGNGYIGIIPVGLLFNRYPLYSEEEIHNIWTNNFDLIKEYIKTEDRGSRFSVSWDRNNNPNDNKEMVVKHGSGDYSKSTAILPQYSDKFVIPQFYKIIGKVRSPYTEDYTIENNFEIELEKEFKNENDEFLYNTAMWDRESIISAVEGLDYGHNIHRLPKDSVSGRYIVKPLELYIPVSSGTHTKVNPTEHFYKMVKVPLAMFTIPVPVPRAVIYRRKSEITKTGGYLTFISNGRQDISEYVNAYIKLQTINDMKSDNYNHSIDSVDAFLMSLIQSHLDFENKVEDRGRENGLNDILNPPHYIRTANEFPEVLTEDQYNTFAEILVEENDIYFDFVNPRIYYITDITTTNVRDGFEYRISYAFSELVPDVYERVE